MSDPFDPLDDDVSETMSPQARWEQEFAADEAAHLLRSKEAYTRVFKTGGATEADIEFVMHDLGWFCGAHKSAWRSDMAEMAFEAGKRDVFLRVLEYAGLDYQTLAVKYLTKQS